MYFLIDSQVHAMIASCFLNMTLPHLVFVYSRAIIQKTSVCIHG